jgi:nucleoid-associated protein YgaU
VARIAVPGLLVGLATTGVVAATTGPADSTIAVPAAVVSSATAPAEREQRTSRAEGDARPALSSAAAAAAQAKTAAAAKAKAKAKAASAAKAKAADAAAKSKAKAKAAKEAEAAAARAKAAVKPPALEVVGSRYTRVDLNVRAAADPGSTLLTVLTSGSKLSVTDTVRDGWRYISYSGRGAWVKNQYLVTKKPVAAKATTSAPAGLSSAACSGGSAVESGLTPDAIRVHRAICARFPAVRSYGGVRADSLPAHPSGRALDAMVSDTGLGRQIANYVRANAQQLGVSEVIFAQQIWTVQRGSEGWRSMSDRGSATANHYDHVHVTVYGSSGS